MSITQRCSKCGRLIPVSEYSEDGFKRQVCKECEQAEQEAAKPKTKVCECCGRELPIESFLQDKRCKDGYNPKCKECEEFLKSNVEPKFKTCPHCKKILPLYRFSNCKNNRYGKSSWCKTCKSEHAATMRETFRNTPHPTLSSKICSRCGRELPIEMFNKSRCKKDGYDSWCKDCMREARSLRGQKKRMQKLVPGWTAPTQEDIDRSVDNIPTLPPFPMPTKRPKPTSAIEERKDWLIKSIRESKGDYPKEMLNDFFLYWSELDANGLSMRFEKEQTWETSKRLRRWYLHSQKPSSNTPTPEPQRAVSPTPPKVEQEPTIPYPEEPTPPKREQDDIDRLVESIPYPPDSPQRTYDLRPPKIKQPVEQAAYSPQTLTIRFKAGDKVIRLKDGIFLLEQLSGNLKGSLSSKGAEILYETTDGDMVADKDLFKNKREALERTKLAGIPEDRLTYGNKPIK